MCPGCFVSPLVGSFLGNLFDSVKLHPNRPLRFKILSITSSCSLTFLTMYAIKKIFKISYCGANGLSIGRIFAVGLASAAVGLIYSFAINYLLNKYFPLPSSACPKNKGKSCCS